jgi:hypothetical protein
MQTKKQTVKKEQKTDSNVKDPTKSKTLEELKVNINKRFEDIEHNFYLIGIDLLKVNLYVVNFRRWIQENTTIGVSTAYLLMQLVKRDQELSGSDKYKSIKPKISFSKLTKLLKYPADFIDKLDFAKSYDVPGGQKFNLLDMPRELFAEVIDHEFRMLTAKERGAEDELSGVPIDEIVLKKSQEKLAKLCAELENIGTVLLEIHVGEESKEKITKAVEQIESISSQAQHISEVSVKILSTLKTEEKKEASAKKVA